MWDVDVVRSGSGFGFRGVVTVTGASPFVNDLWGGLDHVAAPSEMANDMVAKTNVAEFDSMSSDMVDSLVARCLYEVSDLEQAMATADNRFGLLIRLDVD